LAVAEPHSNNRKKKEKYKRRGTVGFDGGNKNLSIRQQRAALIKAVKVTGTKNSFLEKGRSAHQKEE